LAQSSSSSYWLWSVFSYGAAHPAAAVERKPTGLSATLGHLRLAGKQMEKGGSQQRLL